ncbi:MAG: lytic transglycosylase domain-containing protein [Acidobacteria bacterium]|nr:lytic transglycosylase domain-containing protein [Acidobacteriota bacterium]
MKDRIGFTTKVFLVFLVSLCLGGSSSLLAAPFSFAARHDHLRGGCDGKLTIGDTEVGFESAKHTFHWPYLEVQQLRLLDDGRVDLLTYEDGPKWKLGADREFHFKLSGDQREALRFLQAKLGQRLIGGSADPPGSVLAQFAVKHQVDKAQSRRWRWEDIETISSSGRYQLTITTFERDRLHYANARAFNFQLKQPISEETFNVLWRKVNKAQGLEIFEKLRSEVSRQADAALAAKESFNAEAPRSQSVAESLGVISASSASLRFDTPWPTPMQARIAQILAQEGLPADLLGVAKVESNFNPLALSPRSARGVWQLIPETARRFGLRVDGGVDERVDVERSTRAAARYLKELYTMFGDWKLALAGYNAGEKRVQSAQARTGSRDFARLASLLPRETRYYVPSVLAASGAASGAWQPDPGRGYRLFAPARLM